MIMMTKWDQKIKKVQKRLQSAGWDGWLLYDFRRTNDLACRFLEIPSEVLLTRRFFYWIPAEGETTKIVNRMESLPLSHASGHVRAYSSYVELEEQLKKTLKGCRKIAMEYSHLGAIPVVSKVDAGTIELIRSFGVEVESSADILQESSVWTDEQLKGHIFAGSVLQQSVEDAWELIKKAIERSENIDEADVQAFLLSNFERHGCVVEDPPICAVNANSADPHYIPTKKTAAPIKRGDFLLIDVSCKKNLPQAVFADITRVAVIGTKPDIKQQNIFEIVKKARDAALTLIKKRLKANLPIEGWEVDQVCREEMIKAGYGKFFIHRTGHNIGERVHGDGANIDNFETKDYRRLLPGTCFSIEPGIYLPGEFGIRLEDDIFLNKDGVSMQITKGMQTKIPSI